MTGPAPNEPPVPAAVRPPAPRDPLWFAPVFVLAPARSHSTVVTTMIGMHPQLSSFPELALFRRATVAELVEDPPGWRGAPAHLRLAGLLRALAQAHHGEQTEDTVAAAWQWLHARTAWRTEDICDHLLAAVAPRVGVEKSPENSSREEYLVRLAAAYPRARFVHLARHPATSVASMIRVWKDLGYWNITAELFPNFCVGVWYYQHLRIRRFVSALPPDRALTIRAEDALNDPHRCLPEVCRRLGIDASAAAVEAMCHPERAPHARLGPPGALGGGDAAFLESPAPHAVELPGSLELPVQWSVDPWLAASAAELAGQLGYV